MPEKNIVIVITSSPYATLNNYEALRLAVGLFDAHVTVVWKGEGVYNTLTSTESSSARAFIRMLGDLNVGMFVDEQDLELRSLEGEQLIPEVKRIPRREVLETVRHGNVVLTF